MSGGRVVVLAGEPSGDQHAAALVRELRGLRPGLDFAGIGGPAMEAEGVELLAGLDRLAVVGFAEVLSRLAWFRNLERRLAEVVAAADLVVPVDFPGLNLRVAAEARRLRRRVLYYIPPKVWAWRESRARTLAGVTDAVASILPFEVKLLRRHGVRASFVGHPILDRAPAPAGRAEFCARLGLDPARPILAVLPGSRPGELARHGAPFRETCRRVVAACPDVQPVVGAVVSLNPGSYAAMDLPRTRDTWQLLHVADAGLVKSGTATLEAAVAGLPHVVAYRTSALSWQVVKRVLRVPFVSLPNLVAGEEVVPEFIQDAMDPRRMAPALLALLEPGGPALQQRDAFRRVRARLGEPGVAARVARMAVELMDGGGGGARA